MPEVPEISSGDTAWVLTSAALVMFMTPGLALFYGGLVRSKNILGTIMHSFFMLGVISIQFAVIGYSLAFGPDHGGIIGGLDFAFLKDVSMSEASGYAATIPHQTFFIFQLMFAVITPALITGAFAERAKFSTFLVFMLLWATIVYDPVAHWVWGQGGWLGLIPEENGDVGLKALDFAGGTVVHVNAGRAVAAGGLASNAFTVTHIAAAAAAVTWTAFSWLVSGKPSVVGAAAGAVAGLVAITPASGFVTPMGAVAIGIGSGALCYLAVRLRAKVGLDDSLDVVGVHGVGGTWGAIATGIFCYASVNSVGVDGLIAGGGVDQLGKQIVAVGATMIYSFVVTFVLLKVLDMVMGLRVSEDEEGMGLDASQHGERAYLLDSGNAPYAGIPTG